MIRYLATYGSARVRKAALLGTIPPFGTARYEVLAQPGSETLRLAVNDALRRQTDWPVVDFAAALADPDDAHRLAPGYDSGDGVHPNDAGAAALADAIDLSVFAS